MTKFEKRMEEVRQQAKEENKNVNIGAIVLNALYDELTAEQQKTQNEKFSVILENLIEV